MRVFEIRQPRVFLCRLYLLTKKILVIFCGYKCSICLYVEAVLWNIKSLFIPQMSRMKSMKQTNLWAEQDTHDIIFGAQMHFEISTFCLLIQ